MADWDVRGPTRPCSFIFSLDEEMDVVMTTGGYNKNIGGGCLDLFRCPRPLSLVSSDSGISSCSGGTEDGVVRRRDKIGGGGAQTQVIRRVRRMFSIGTEYTSQWVLSCTQNRAKRRSVISSAANLDPFHERPDSAVTFMDWHPGVKLIMFPKMHQITRKDQLAGKSSKQESAFSFPFTPKLYLPRAYFRKLCAYAEEVPRRVRPPPPDLCPSPRPERGQGRAQVSPRLSRGALGGEAAQQQQRPRGEGRVHQPDQDADAVEQDVLPPEVHQAAAAPKRV